MAVSSRALSWIGKRSNWRQLGLFIRLVGRRFTADRCLQTASSLTYTTLLSLVPFLVVSLAILSVFGAVSNMRETVKGAVLDALLPTSRGQVGAQIDQFLGNAETLTAPGLAAIAVTAIMLLFTIEGTFNRIWRVANPRALGLRILRFWTVLTLGPLLLGASLSLTSYFFAVGDDDMVTGALQELSRLLPLTLQWLAFSLLYMTMPHASVLFRHAALGGLVAAVLFEVLKLGFAIYIDNADNFRVIYGALAAIPIFLMWLYSSWTVILVGAEVTAALPQWRRDLTRDRAASRSASVRLAAALNLLEQLWHLSVQGKGLARDAPEALEATWAGDVLQTLLATGFIAETADNQLLIGRDLSRTSVQALWQALDLGVPTLDPDAPAIQELRVREAEVLQQQTLSQLLADRAVQDQSALAD
jgi:membrane protein